MVGFTADVAGNLATLELTAGGVQSQGAKSVGCSAVVRASEAALWKLQRICACRCRDAR